MFKLSQITEEVNTESQKVRIRAEMAARAKIASSERAVLKYRCPETAEEWWNVVYTYWDDLLLIVGKYVRLSEMVDVKGEISCSTLLNNAIQAKKNKEVQLAILFNKAWWQAPDNGNIHGDMAWGILCDLCSEDGVLHED
jgi:hypothetical protein